MLKYNEEDVGELHRTGRNGNRIKLRNCYDAGEEKRPERYEFCKRSRCVRHFVRRCAQNCAVVTIFSASRNDFTFCYYYFLLEIKFLKTKEDRFMRTHALYLKLRVLTGLLALSGCALKSHSRIECLNS